MAVKLSGLSSQNPWWRDADWHRIDPDMKKIEHLFERKEIPLKKVTVVRGIRRVGKTVYTKMLIERLIREGVKPRNILYISCDRYSAREVKNIAEEFILRTDGGYLFLDEITSLHEWTTLIKQLAEEGKATLFATGSNPVQIKKYSERLPGRGIEGNEYYMSPLSFREFLRSRRGIELPSISPISPEMADYIPFFDDFQRELYIYTLTGGFPTAVSDYIKHETVRDETMEMIMRTLLGVLSKEGKSEEIARGILERLLAAGAGRTDYQTIAKDIGVHHNTVRDYLELMESARIIYVLKAWDISKKRQFPRKEKKIVFQSSLIPLAIHRYISGGAWDDTLDFADRNMEWLVESAVASHLIWSEEVPIMREKHAFAGFFYSSSSKIECDFLMLKNGAFYGFETKFGRLRRRKYPFPVMFISRDEMDENSLPASVFLAGIEKSDRNI